nr:phosphatase PAP2 family protein [SAR324 cluster bacterium]
MPIFFRLKTQLIVFGLLLMIAIILSHLGGIDRDISRYFYDITNHWWQGKKIYFFKFSYQYLTAPAYFVWLYVSTEFFYRKFIIGESISANYKQLARLKLILSLLGALLAVELIKYFIDRARPYMLTEFGGSFDYQAIGFLVSDGASNGNSFPSGHAVAGFCLTSL